MTTPDRRGSSVRLEDVGRPKSSTKTKRPSPSTETLHEKFRIYDIPDNVLNWCFKCFSKVSPKCAEDVTLWSVKHALISAGQELSEERILEMITDIGKIEHDGLKINFREFSLMCWRNLFQNDDEGVGEVKEAFQILGGNDDGSGVVNVERLKDFTRRSELSIDIDRFVADVDDDRSGMVDYEEFRQLFDGSLDTAQLFSDDKWLRTEAGNTDSRSSPSRSRTRPVAVSIDGALDARGSRSPTSARPASASLSVPFGRTDSAGSAAAASRPPPSRTSALFRPPPNPDSPFLGGEAPATHGRHSRTGPRSRRHDGAGTGAGRSPDALAPAAAKRRRFEASRMTCRRGWRVNACHCNMPGVEGYNAYHADGAAHADLASAVRLRGRGGEWAVREAAAARLCSRPPTEERCRKVLHVAGPLASTEERCRRVLLPITPAAGTGPQRLLFASRVGTAAGPPRSPVAPYGGRGGARLPDLRLPTAAAADVDGSPGARRRYADPERERAWRTNMRTPPPVLRSTEELLRLASLAGLYGVGGDESGLRAGAIGSGYFT